MYGFDDIKDIKGPLTIPIPWIYWVIAGVVIVMGVWVITSYFMRRNANLRHSVLPEAPLRPAHEIAWERLILLESKNLPALGKIEEYYTGISHIVRHYIEDRFNLRAPEMTTEEFFMHVHTSEICSPEQKNLLQKFLSHCDLVKFAQYTPSAYEMRVVLESAKRYIEETKQLPIEPQRISP